MPFFITKKPQNIFVALLNEFGVKHTQTFSGAYFDENPDKRNMYGISRMLSDYKIENQGIRVKNKAAVLAEIDIPFLAHTNNDFLIVTHIDMNQVEYIGGNERITAPLEEFVKIWSGNALLAYPDKDSIEPGYKKNRTDELIGKIKNGLLYLSICSLIGLMFFISGVYTQWGLIFSLLINAVGLSICYLLLLKQMYTHSRYADKICSLFQKEKKCNSVLESDAANFLGLFTWSELGMGYFTANLIVLLLFPTLYPYSVWINIISLPYSIWSVWYQRFRIRQWCSLCLFIQGVLWLLFFSNMAFGLITQPVIIWSNLLLTVVLYTIPILTLSLFVPRLSEAERIKQLSYELNSFKRDSQIFATYLRAHTFYDTENASSILWGNPKAKNRITVITNPHCDPCAKMHEKLENLLEKTNNGYCIQYVLTAFSEELEDSNRLFIDRYQKSEQTDFLRFMGEWHQKGKYNYYEFYRKYPFDKGNESLMKEFNKHKIWVKSTSIRATPILLFNGFELPGKYRVEDLVHFCDLNI